MSDPITTREAGSKTVRNPLLEELPAHYFDCDRFQTYDYGTRAGACNCAATEDVKRMVAALEEARSALAEVRGYVSAEAPHTPTTDELKRVLTVVREALRVD